MTSIAPGVSLVDLQFLGHSGVVATGVLSGRHGTVLVDPGPSTTLPTLRASLADAGIQFSDVRALLITHIHLDHAGATGTLAELCPDARVFVHSRGAPHMADPSRLLASAGRLYGDDMDRLWGEVRPVPADRLAVLRVGDEGDPDALTIDAAGWPIDVAWTPGHAWHHVSYFVRDAGIAFVGDTAGLRRQGSPLVLPASPPPDVDLEAWRVSVDRILAWHPEQLFLTHFGPHRDPAGHFADLWTRFDDWSRRVKAVTTTDARNPEAAAAFLRDVSDALTAELGQAEAEAYAAAGRFDYSFTGLERYWRKRLAAG